MRDKRAEFFNFNNYTYAFLEEALARAYAFYPDNLSLLRSKIKNFQRIHVTTGRPGKGQKITYRMHELCYWGFVFELVDFGFPPGIISLLMQDYRYGVQDCLMETVDLEDEDYYAKLDASFMHSPQQFDRSLRLFTICTETELSSIVRRSSIDRSAIVNLSKLKEKLQYAMQDVYENSGIYYEETHS